MGAVSWYTLVVYILLSAKTRAYFCKSIVIEMGGVSRYFSKALGSGVDLTLLILDRWKILEKCQWDILSAWDGLQIIRSPFGSFFGSLLLVFQTIFRIKLECFWGQFRSAGVPRAAFLSDCSALAAAHLLRRTTPAFALGAPRLQPPCATTSQPGYGNTTTLHGHAIRVGSRSALRPPKDSAALKILCHSKFTMHSKFTGAQWFTIATPLCGQHFLGFTGISPLKQGSTL